MLGPFLEGAASSSMHEQHGGRGRSGLGWLPEVAKNAGGFAAFCAVPEERLIRLPDAMSFDMGAAFYIQSLTAWHLLHTVSKTRAGDTLLIHAIGGGVGLQLAQLAKMAGAVVIGTVGTAGKEAKALAFGADRVVNRGSEDFVSVCNAMTYG